LEHTHLDQAPLDESWQRVFHRKVNAQVKVLLKEVLTQLVKGLL
jgi:hypothetical protein